MVKTKQITRVNYLTVFYKSEKHLAELKTPEIETNNNVQIDKIDVAHLSKR